MRGWRQMPLIAGKHTETLDQAGEHRQSTFFTFKLTTPESLQANKRLRGRPLMIWGGGPEENLKMNLFFPRNSLSN